MKISIASGRWAALAFATILGSTAAVAGTPLGDLTPLSADFNDKTPGQPIGTGGAAVGEPVSLSVVDTLIVEASPGENFLQLSMDPLVTSAQSIGWQFEDDLEVSEGLISLWVDFTPSVRDGYSIGVSEHGGSTKTFLSLTFNASGQLYVNDAAGLIGNYLNVYDAGDTIRIEMLFDMDARTSSLSINGNPMFSGRAHGISDRGVGRLRTGFKSGSSGSPFALDNLLVLATVPLPLVLDADFNDKTPEQPIGTGGAAAGEPVFFDNSLTQKAFDVGTGNLALQLWSTAPGLAQFPHWEFLNKLQIRTGIVAFDMDLRFQELGRYMVRVYGPSTATDLFGVITFSPDPMSTTSGNIVVNDMGGTAGVVGAFQFNVFHRLQWIYDLDQGTYTIKLDGNVLLEDRPHSITSGVGIRSLWTGFPSNGSISAFLDIDNLQVGASDAPIIPAQITFLQEPTVGEVNEALSPAFEMAVDNVFGELMPDGTQVSLEIVIGPAGAVLSGAIEPMVAGVARFDNLSADLPGTYRLRARSVDASQLSSADIVISDPSERIFEDGFEVVLD